MSTSRESDLEGALKRAKEVLGDCQRDLADNSLLEKADQLLGQIGDIIDQLEGQTNGHPT